MKHLACVAALIVTPILNSFSPNQAIAAGVVGTGTPESCTEAALNAALAGGGGVTFDCGTSPVTITVTAMITITAAASSISPVLTVYRPPSASVVTPFGHSSSQSAGTW